MKLISSVIIKAKKKAKMATKIWTKRDEVTMAMEM